MRTRRRRHPSYARVSRRAPGPADDRPALQGGTRYIELRAGEDASPRDPTAAASSSKRDEARRRRESTSRTVSAASPGSSAARGDEARRTPVIRVSWRPDPVHEDRGRPRGG
jgi:hypothetical protein